MKAKRFFTSLIALILLFGFIPSMAFAEEYDLAAGSIQVTADNSGQYVTQESAGHVNVQQTTPTVIHQTDSATQSTSNTISVSASSGTTADITLGGVNIEANTSTTAPGDTAIAVEGSGTVCIELDGNNTVVSGREHAGIENNSTALIIQDENAVKGSLTATGGYNGAGIGGGKNQNGANITINSGDVTATGGGNAAGIGGGDQGTGTNITINGGTVNALSTDDGSGIGGGGGKEGNGISISGGTVNASGGKLGGAAIGGGGGADGKNITISGGKVTADNRHLYSTWSPWAAGIGGGSSGDGVNIKITGGEVYAYGGYLSAGIGGGINANGENISISGGTVNSTGGNYGAGIGGGSSGDANGIYISGGKVNATGGNYGAGIGGGNYGGDGINISISGGEVTAKGGVNAAGIGGGSGYNGSVTATEFYGTAKNIHVSGNAQLTVMKGDMHHSLWNNKCGYGAWIGEGGGYVDNNAREGLEVEPDISRLYTDGYVRYFGYRTIFGTYIPPEPAEPVWGTPEDAPYFPLRVIDANGVELVFTHEIDNGVLTVTTEHGFAILTGSIGNLNTLSESGVKTIVFTTTDKTTSVELEALKNAGSSNDVFRLTHDAANATLTVSGKEADGIIK